MKFGQELQDNIYEPWRFQYVSYDTIKMDMRNRQEQHGWTDKDEADFERTIRLEADKVDQFITRKQREIDSRVAYCERTLVQQRAHLSAATTAQLYETMDDALTDILIDLNDLSKYTRYNFLALSKLIKKHDKYTHIDRQSLLVDISRSRAPLDRQRFDATLVKISTLHDLCRLQGEARTGNAAAGADQNAFERATAKYWVHPDNVTELKAILLFHLPVLVFNPNKPVEASDSAISSVYFDNQQYDLYTGRLQRDEGAEAIRFRWYGPMTAKDIYIERKTHHAPWLDGASVKDRFRLDEPKVKDFMEGRYTAEQYDRDERPRTADVRVADQNKFIATGVQKSIAEKQLAPVMRVFYNRTAFQVPGDQRLRVSLDTDLTFVREDGNRRRGQWRRPDMGIDHPFENLSQDDVYRFPYAVLETKLQTHLGQEPPQWLTRLLDSKLVYEVPRFSKYLHGAAHFWSPRLPLLPWWLNEMELDIRNAKQPSGDFMGLSRSKSLKPLIDGRYRMGYLESQLEKRATLKRKGQAITIEPPPMPKAPLPISYRKPVPAMSYSSNNNSDTCVVSVGEKNPFDDPIWNRDIPNDSDSQRTFPSFRNRSPPLGGELRRSTAAEYSSTDRLVDPKQRSSAYLNGKSTPRDSVLIQDDIVQQPSEKPEKKKKKKKDKDAEKAERLEPKIFFANERTFINWLQFSALILTASISLLNFGDHTSKIVGAVFFAISMVLALYAFGRYRYRAWQITTRPRIRYDDLYGPIGLVILLVGALVVNFGLRYSQPAPTSTTYLNINSTTGQQT
ncbi:VTC domain-domain-containing protein [Syncephalastrum racemosum]|uniref:VTC domain-domain-containing protein n=1 Tax=Syncephalastrum racemosum TaxID=13706 RepID=A0A1X2H771_SYNRA|nr:VTC domain-domain-containing protein [Syncephalastrum racemosum]